MQPLRLLSVHAHPDDEASKGAATVAKYVAEGIDVMIATCTGGERGDVLNPKLKNEEVNLLGDEVRTAKSPAEYAESHVNKSLSFSYNSLKFTSKPKSSKQS